MSNLNCNIQTTIDYEKETFIEVAIGKDAYDIKEAHPFKRTDFHEDGSKSTYFGFEISEKEYQLFMKFKDTGIPNE